MNRPIGGDLRGERRLSLDGRCWSAALVFLLFGQAVSSEELLDQTTDPAADKTVVAPEMIYLAPRSRPPSFEYEQCANACQIERDRLLSACGVPDNPNRPSYDKPLNCTNDNIKEYVACLAMCPADTGADDVP